MNTSLVTRMARRLYHSSSMLNRYHPRPTAYPKESIRPDTFRVASPLLSRRVRAIRKMPFGVEIESVVSKTGRRQSHSDVRAVLDKNHSSWSCVSDDSIENTNHPMEGEASTLKCEFVSPKLQLNPATTSEIKSVCSTLHDLNAQVNATCGLHVHFDAEELEVQDLIRIAINYAFFEEVIDGFMDKSRRANENKFIKSVADPVVGNFEQLCDVLQEIHHGRGNYSKRSLSVLDMINPHRKLHKMNFTNAFYYSLSTTGLGKQNASSEQQYINTVENRHHDATLSARDIMYWVRFNMAFIEHSKHKTFFNLRQQPSVSKKVEMLADFIDDDQVMYHCLDRMSLHA